MRRLALITLALFLLASAALAEPVPANVDIATLSAGARTLAPGDTLTLSVQYKYPAAADEPLLWVTSSGTVASISGTDASNPVTVTALKDGRAAISLVGSRSGRTLAKCQVTVRTVKISSFSLSRKTLTIAPGQVYTGLSAAIKPSTATFRTVTWATSDASVAAFNAAGLDTATGANPAIYSRNPGVARITAQTQTGRKLTCVVTVKPLAVKSVQFPKSKYTVYWKDPGALKLTAVVSPATAGVAPEYASSAPEIADIDKVTGALTLKATGTVTITASAGGKTGTCKLTVASKDIKSLSIWTPGSAAVVLNPAGTAQLTAVASPAYADNREVTWASDNTGVATVDSMGKVTAVAGGVANITVTSQFSAAVHATVAVHVRGDAAVMRTVTISAAGDAVLGGDPRSLRGGATNPYSDQEFQAAIVKPGDDSAAGDGTVFTRVDSYFAGENNIATLNLEGTLTSSKNFDPHKSFVFRGLPAYASTMLLAHHIDAVNIANNHSYDVGTPGYNDTKANLTRAGVRPYGNSITNSVTSENGLQVGFLGFVSKGLSAGTLRSRVQSAAKKYDMVVVAFHWTDVPEFRYAYPTGRQQMLARAAISAGADLVVGHHTHRLNGIERYKDKFIAYDLGNFVTIARNPLNQFQSSNPQGKYDYDSMIYQQKFNVWADGFVEAAGITLVPCAITSAYNSQVNNCQPTPYTSSSDINRVIQKVQSHSPSDFSKYPITNFAP